MHSTEAPYEGWWGDRKSVHCAELRIAGKLREAGPLVKEFGG